MAKQALVIGLGQFGSSVAKSLSEHGSEVLAVDVNETHVREVAPFVSDAVQVDAMDEDALATLSPADRDTCICAIGDENREGSIVVTALLRQLGAVHIISRSTDVLHARILRLVGAHEVIDPERNYGERLAMRLAWRNVLNMLPLGGGLVLTEVRAPQSFWGKTLAELNLRQERGVMVAAVRASGRGDSSTAIPEPQRALGEGDVLMLVSTEKRAREVADL